MYDEYLNDDMRAAVRKAVVAAPDAMLNELARQIGIPEGAVVAALPHDMCAVAPREIFESVWTAMTGWEKVTFVASAPGALVEVKGRLPQGRFSHGFFNIGEDDNSLGGHLAVSQLKAVCFVSKPFMGMESHAVRFYNHQAQLMFAVYVGRNGKTLIPSVKDAFLALRRDSAPEAVL
jgi:heme iron utilization protein